MFAKALLTYLLYDSFMHHQYLLRTSLNTLCTVQIQGIDDTHNVDVQCQLIKHNTQGELHMYK